MASKITKSAVKRSPAAETPQPAPSSPPVDYTGGQNIDPNYQRSVGASDLELPGGADAQQEGRDVLKLWQELSGAFKDPQDPTKWVKDAGVVRKDLSGMSGQEAYEHILNQKATQLREGAQTPEGKGWVELFINSANPDYKHKFHEGGASRETETRKQSLDPITLDHPKLTQFLSSGFSNKRFFKAPPSPAYFGDDLLHKIPRKANQWADWSRSLPVAMVYGDVMTPDERSDAIKGPFGDYPTMSSADIFRRVTPGITAENPKLTELAGLISDIGVSTALNPAALEAAATGIVKRGATRMATEAAKAPLENMLKRAGTLAESRLAEKAIQESMKNPELLGKSTPGFVNSIKNLLTNPEKLSSTAYTAAKAVYDPIPTAMTGLMRARQNQNLQGLAAEVAATSRGVSQAVADGSKFPLQPNADLGQRMFTHFYNTAESPKALERAAQKFLDYTNEGYAPISGSMAQMAHAAKLREEALGTTMRRAESEAAKLNPELSTAEVARVGEAALSKPNVTEAVWDANQRALQSPRAQLERRLLNVPKADAISKEIDAAAGEVTQAELELQQALNSRSGYTKEAEKSLINARDAAMKRLRKARSQAASFAQELNDMDPETIKQMQREIPPTDWQDFLAKTLEIDNAVKKTSELAQDSKAALKDFRQAIAEIETQISGKQGALEKAGVRSKAAEAVRDEIMQNPKATFTDIHATNKRLREDLRDILQGKTPRPSSEEKALIQQAVELNKLEENAIEQAVPGINAGQGYKETREAYGLNKELVDFLNRGQVNPESIEITNARMADSLAPLAGRVAMGQAMPAHQATTAQAVYMAKPKWDLKKISRFSTPLASQVAKGGSKNVSDAIEAVARLWNPEKMSMETPKNRDSIRAQREYARMKRENIDPALIELIIQNLPKE